MQEKHENEVNKCMPQTLSAEGVWKDSKIDCRHFGKTQVMITVGPMVGPMLCAGPEFTTLLLLCSKHSAPLLIPQKFNTLYTAYR
jgi:hypothetical protein